MILNQSLHYLTDQLAQLHFKKILIIFLLKFKQQWKLQ
nr:MAG TPA: hypothetical protein [Caudoviricetes sp.]